MQQQLEEERAQAQRRVAWLPGECSRFEIIITEVRFKVQQAREEAIVKAGEAESAKQLVGRLQQDVDKLATGKGLDHLIKQAREEELEARRNHVLALARVQSLDDEVQKLREELDNAREKAQASDGLQQQLNDKSQELSKVAGDKSCSRDKRILGQANQKKEAVQESE
jgi:hypothetical protein